MRYVIFIFISLGLITPLAGKPKKQILLPHESPYEPSTSQGKIGRPCDEQAKNYATLLAQALTEARSVLKEVVLTPQDTKATVIFDIDNTVLDTTKTTGTSAFLWSEQLLLFFQAIPEILTFYNELLARGFKVIFLSGRLTKSTPDARIDDVLSATANNLCEAGFSGYERLICMPYEDRKKYRIGYWKELIRKKLVENERYDIFLTIDDDPHNLVGEYLGYPIEIPSKFLRIDTHCYGIPGT